MRPSGEINHYWSFSLKVNCCGEILFIKSRLNLIMVVSPLNA